MTFGKYAAQTSVPVDRSKAEIERVLEKYGAARFGTMTEPDKATVYFEVKGRQLQWAIPLPDKSKLRDKYDQEVRRRWRVLVITIKAMLEAVESGLLSFDEAFLSHIVIPGTAKTIGEALNTKRIDAIYAGKTPALLLAENEP